MTIELQIKAQEKRIAGLERALNTLAKEMRAQGTYDKRLKHLEKAISEIEKKADFKALEKQIKANQKAMEKSEKEAMAHVRKLNVDARIGALETLVGNLHKMVQTAMNLAASRR
ncbi:MAG: hypothetical protein VR70_16775 [Rhodospirillaceae bacterium BRH_c57]|nr:MAG: hypothetical protein VR70_16775 [Rhodospirillaceae bacterium BRH_c57]